MPRRSFMPAPGLAIPRGALVSALVALALLAGGAAAVAAPPAATATTTTAPSAAPGVPCVGAGVLAVAAPGAAPVAVGPSVSADTRTATSAPSDAELAGVFSAQEVQVGAAGCVDAAGRPGGTAVVTGAWTLFGGAVSGTTLESDLVPSAASDGSGWHLRQSVEGLQVDGHAAALSSGFTLAVGTWGVLRLLPRIDAGPGQQLRWWEAAIELRLTLAHGGLAAGTRLLVGFAAADRPWAPPAPAPSRPASTTPEPTTSAVTTTTTTPSEPPARKPAARTAPRRAQHVARRPRKKPVAHHAKKTRKIHRAHRKAASGLPLHVTPPLGRGVYDFPVAGPVAWGDSYGGARNDVPGGWHHGDDLFAGLGAPVVAVTDGTVFSVGWNPVGGWRLWIADDGGNDFYYAHLSGYTALARNDHRIRRGQVLGFVGNTGDAFTTSDHLHFEVHPNGLLFLGYDGAVDPTSYLARWQRLGPVATLPPAALPPGPARGYGVLMNYRRLLALHAPKNPPHRAPPPAARPASIEAVRRAAQAAGEPSTAGHLARVVGITLACAACAFALLGQLAVRRRNAS